MAFSISTFRDKTRKYLLNAATELNREVPNVSFNVSRVEDSGIYLSALIKDAPTELPDLVDLEISIKELEGGKDIIDVDVVWGHDGHGCVEGSFYSEPITIDEHVLERVYLDLPRLILVLKTAVQRKKPYNWEK